MVGGHVDAYARALSTRGKEDFRWCDGGVAALVQDVQLQLRAVRETGLRAQA